MSARSGTVYLVGAGPGDPDLITRRALRLLQTADVVLHDRLAPIELLGECSPRTQFVDVGKTAGDHAMPQEQINAELVRHARRGHAVVRLKGGDPYVFGRGGEEAAHCHAAGVPVEVVPAVTSAVAVPAAAGIPVTHRGVARSFTVVTASAGTTGTEDPDYAWLAKADGTVVLLMGLRRLKHVAKRLVAEGAPRSRPVAVISRGTTIGQRTVTGTLGTIAKEVERAQLPAPAIIVVGDVVALRPELSWFESRPLWGLTVTVTRARSRASGLVSRLRELGAEVVEAPAIRTAPTPPTALDALVANISRYGTVLFTSATGAMLFFDRLRAAGRDARSLGAARVCVVGAMTAEACAAQGVLPDLVPLAGRRSSAGLLEMLAREPLFGTRVALVRAEDGDERLPDGLRALGATVDLVVAYRTLVEPLDEATVERVLASDLVTFASESTVRNLTMFLPPDRPCPPAVSIGPITTAGARRAGWTIVGEAAEPSVDALVDAVCAVAGRPTPDSPLPDTAPDSGEE